MAASPSPSPDADLAVGSVLDGRYRIDAILGTGGMGRVYRGEHTGIGRPVAIKVLHADLSRNKEAAQRFQREALASGRLDHPNIVGVSDFGIVEDGPCYLVMEVLEGESLGARLEREKRIPWRDAIEILRGVLYGLRHAHDRGVVHRDIKPDNIFLARKDGDVIVKILDFGIAKLYAGSPDDPASTRVGLTVGTPAYLSPEQAVGGEIKPASDLYSATILLFEMIAGRPPFDEKDPLAMLGAHVSRTPPRLAEVAPELDVPPALEDVIQRGLQKTASERISSANEYLSLLDVVLAAERASAPSFFGQPVAPPTSGAAPAPTFTPVHGTSVAGLTPLPDPSGGAPAVPTPSPSSSPAPSPAPLSGPHTPAPVSFSAPTEALPVQTRSISLAEAPPLPRTWIKVGAIVLAVVVLAALVAALSSGDSASERRDTSTSSTPPAPPPVVPVAPKVDKATRLKALLHDLESAKTCEERKAAIPRLVELGDKAAIPHLRKARYRMRGGVLGIGDSNANACLKSAAEAAIEKLGG